MEEKNLKEMTVSDVCGMQLFMDNLDDVIREWRDSHKMAGLDKQLKRHPIDFLTENHLFEPYYMRTMFINVVNKESRFSADIRAFIKRVGMEAYNRTINVLKANETEEFSDNGND